MGIVIFSPIFACFHYCLCFPFIFLCHDRCYVDFSFFSTSFTSTVCQIFWLPIDSKTNRASHEPHFNAGNKGRLNVAEQSIDRPQGIHRINLESPEPLFDHRADLLYSIWYFGRTFFPRIYTELSALLGITQGGRGVLDSGWVRLIVQCLLLNTFCILSEQLEYPKLHKLVNTDH